ncbi:MAG: shikimate dehydrogenase [Bacteroidetes bacterium]|nr:shikimate dehydrogenase [Bacteroidota bacterium]
MKKKYGLIGFKLGHSFSKKYFTEFFKKENLIDCVYDTYSFENINELKKQVDGLEGFNVTIPHKCTIIPLLDSLSPEAKEIGAVNCVRIFDDKKMIGYNTDCYGFEKALLSMIKEARPHALVFGTGGASKAVCYVLKKLGISYKSVSRRKTDTTITYDEVTSEMLKRVLLINATPLGMFPNVDEAPNLDYEKVSSDSYFFDLTYNPADTKFTRKGRRQHATVKNGYQMLIEQAIKAWEIYNS